MSKRGWTKFAVKNKFVVEAPPLTGTYYWDDPKTGRYLAFGRGHHTDKPIKFSYQTGYMNITQIWADFCGRSGLTTLWWENPEDNSRHLIWREW